MIFNQHWLEIAEYLSLIFAIIGVIASLVSGQIWYIIIPILITVFLNFINRLRQEYRSQIHLNNINNSYQQLADKITKLEQNIKFQKNNLIASNSNYTESIEETRSNIMSDSIPLSKFEIPQWQAEFNFTGHQDGITSLAISPDGKFLVTVSWDETLKIWSLTTGELIISSPEQNQGLLSVIFTNIVTNNLDNNEQISYNIATGGFNQNIYLWQFNSNDYSLSLLHTLTGHIGSIRILKFADSCSILLSGSYDQTIKQWDLSKYILSHSSYDPLGDIHSLTLFPKTDLIAGAGGDGTITIWQIGNGRKIKLLIGNIYSVESIAISQNQEIIAAGCIDGKIRFWPWENQPQPSQVMGSFLAHSGPVIFLEFDKDQHLLYSGGADGTIKVWYLDYQHNQSIRSQLLNTLEITDESTNHLHRVLSVVFSPDHCRLSIGTVDGLIKVFQRV
jgi:WD40 repeat protein